MSDPATERRLREEIAQLRQEVERMQLAFRDVWTTPWNWPDFTRKETS